MQDDITTMIEECEAAAYADMFAAELPNDGHQAVLTRHQESGALCGVTHGILDPGWSGFFNQVLGLGAAKVATREHIEQIVQLYREEAIPFFVDLSPHAQPAELASWLRDEGLAEEFVLAQCVRDVAPLPSPPTSLHIRRATSAEATTFVEVAAIGLPPSLAPWIASLVGRPGWQHYLACDGDLPVGGAALFVHKQVGYLTWAGTQEGYRGRGAQQALIAERVREAAAHGCQLLVAETAEGSVDEPGGSLRNLLRSGFNIASQKRIFVG